MNEHTTFDEKIVENEAQLPSFTLCPTVPDDPISNISIENFEDLQKAIEKTIINYNIKYTEHKPYEKRLKQLKKSTMIRQMVFGILHQKLAQIPHLKL